MAHTSCSDRTGGSTPDPVHSIGHVENCLRLIWHHQVALVYTKIQDAWALTGGHLLILGELHQNVKFPSNLLRQRILVRKDHRGGSVSRSLCDSQLAASC